MKIIENKIISFTPWTNVYGVARSMIAMGTFLTLFFNSSDSLFIDGGNALKYIDRGFIYKVNLFYILDGYLDLARWISIFILGLVISGWQPRITGLFHWWVTFSFFLSCTVVDGGDQVASILTLLLVPICLTDNRSWHWGKIRQKSSFHRNLIAIISFFFIYVQVFVIYFHSAIAKLNVEQWVDGTALYYWLSHSTHGLSPLLESFILPLFYNNPYIVVIFTWGTIMFELILAAAIILDSSNSFKLNILLKLGLIFHFSIAVTLGLVSFFFSMAGALILYLRPVNSSFSFNFVKRKMQFFLRKKDIKLNINT